jgi:hypothetical protein
MFLNPNKVTKSAVRFDLNEFFLTNHKFESFLVGGPLMCQIFKFEFVFLFLDPNIVKVPSDLFYGEICWIKLWFPHSELEFVWEVPLGLKLAQKTTGA